MTYELRNKKNDPTGGNSVIITHCLWHNYGIGTVFDDSIYHLYQSRMAENIEMFVKRCDQVTRDEFTTEFFTPATTFTL